MCAAMAPIDHSQEPLPIVLDLERMDFELGDPLDMHHRAARRCRKRCRNGETEGNSSNEKEPSLKLWFHDILFAVTMGCVAVAAYVGLWTLSVPYMAWRHFRWALIQVGCDASPKRCYVVVEKDQSKILILMWKLAGLSPRELRSPGKCPCTSDCLRNTV